MAAVWPSSCSFLRCWGLCKGVLPPQSSCHRPFPACRAVRGTLGWAAPVPNQPFLRPCCLLCGTGGQARRPPGAPAFAVLPPLCRFRGAAPSLEGRRAPRHSLFCLLSVGSVALRQVWRAAGRPGIRCFASSLSVPWRCAKSGGPPGAPAFAVLPPLCRFRGAAPSLEGRRAPRHSLFCLLSVGSVALRQVWRAAGRPGIRCFASSLSVPWRCAKSGGPPGAPAFAVLPPLCRFRGAAPSLEGRRAPRHSLFCLLSVGSVALRQVWRAAGRPGIRCFASSLSVPWRCAKSGGPPGAPAFAVLPPLCRFCGAAPGRRAPRHSLFCLPSVGSVALRPVAGRPGIRCFASPLPAPGHRAQATTVGQAPLHLHSLFCLPSVRFRVLG